MDNFSWKPKEAVVGQSLSIENRSKGSSFFFFFFFEQKGSSFLDLWQTGQFNIYLFLKNPDIYIYILPKKKIIYMYGNQKQIKKTETEMVNMFPFHLL